MQQKIKPIKAKCWALDESDGPFLTPNLGQLALRDITKPYVQVDVHVVPSPQYEQLVREAREYRKLARLL